MHTEPLDEFSIATVALADAVLLALAMEIGYRFGRWRHATSPGEQGQPVGAMVASILGLLALVLGFTFSLAASRFDARRQLVLEEANAIGTTYLRARLLPEPQRTEVGRLLREYTDVRIQSSQADKVADSIVRSEAMHERLWAQATEAAEANPGSIMTGVFIQSLNDVIDLHSKRVMFGIRSRIPMVIWIGLLSMAVLGMAGVGYQAAMSETCRSPIMFVLVLAFSIVMYLVADLDRGQEGLLRVSQQPMIDVLRTMQSTPP